MPLFKGITKFFERRKFRNLTPDQTKAVVEALALAMMMDGAASSEEREELRASVEKLPWSAGDDPEYALSRATEAAVELIEEEHGTISAFADELSEQLGEDWLRDEVYLLTGKIVTADREVDPGESDLLRELVRAFGLKGDRLQALTTRLIADEDR